MDLSVVIPAYNEARGIGPTLEQLARVLADSGIEHEVLVVDDGSSDGTGAAIDGLAATLPCVRALHHKRNRGYGAALKTGIRAAAAQVVAITDADGTYPNERLPELYRRLVEADAHMVVGARTGKNVHIPLLRRPPKAFLRWLAQYLSGHEIPDLNSGLRVMRKDHVVACFHLVSNGFSFTTTTLMAFLARDHPVEFVPIDYHHRTGQSKIRPIHDTLNFVNLILRVSVYFEPIKVFLPITLLLGTGGLAWAVAQIATDGGLGEAPVLLLVSALQIGLVGLIADMIARRH